MFLNKVTIIGNLTRDPELKAIPSGAKVVSFSLATNEKYKNTAGEMVEKVEYHNVIAFGKLAENIARYMKKGNSLLVEGKLQTRSWDGTDGKKLYKTEILAGEVQFGSRPAGQAETTTPGEEKTIVYDTGEADPEDIPFS